MKMSLCYQVRSRTLTGYRFSEVVSLWFAVPGGEVVVRGLEI